MHSTGEVFQLQPGQYIGKNYQVVGYLGAGWEGEVYKVEEIETGILRVIKLFYQHKDNQKQRHVQYAKRLYRLSTCPIIIQYHHKDNVYLKKQKVDYVVSDYLKGEVLSEYITRQKGKKFSAFEALHIFYGLVKGVEHIHFLGEYHGDIHDGNILINRKGMFFDTHLIDILHLGRPHKEHIQADVFQLMEVLYALIGGAKHYAKAHPNIKKLILGHKKSLIRARYKNAGQIRLFLDNIGWD